MNPDLEFRAQSAACLADQAAEAIRILNHRTQTGAGNTMSPAEIDRTVAALTTAAARLPQLLRQLGILLLAQERAGRLYVDQASPIPDPATAIATATAALQQASKFASRAAKTLDAAHQTLAHLGVGGSRRL